MGPRIDFLDIIEYIIVTYEKTFVGCTLVQLQADVAPDTMLSGNVLSPRIPPVRIRGTIFISLKSAHRVESKHVGLVFEPSGRVRPESFTFSRSNEATRSHVNAQGH